MRYGVGVRRRFYLVLRKQLTDHSWPENNFLCLKEGSIFGRSAFREEAPSYIWHINISHPFPTANSGVRPLFIASRNGGRTEEIVEITLFIFFERLRMLGYKNGDHGCTDHGDKTDGLDKNRTQWSLLSHLSSHLLLVSTHNLG